MDNSNGQNLRLHYEGVLEKAGKRFFEGFRKRWFILEGKFLSYYKAPEYTEQNLLGIIDMTKVKSVVPFKMINNSFQIITSTRTYTFTAPSSQLMTEWISVLRQGMQLESFSNKRAKSSVRESMVDEGYEVVSRSSRSDSKMSGCSHKSFGEDDTFDEDANLYDQIQSSGSQGKAGRNTEPAGTYESVGSFKRNKNQSQEYEEESYEVVAWEGSLPRVEQDLPAYESVSSVKRTSSKVSDVVARQGSLPRVEQDLQAYESVSSVERTSSKVSGVSDFGSYGVVGKIDKKEPGLPPTDEENMYSQVQKPLKESPPTETSESFYAEVGNTVNNVSNNVASKATAANPMPVLVESDADDEEDEEEDDDHDDSSIDQNIEQPSKDPLPPPIGNTYATDKIKSLLHGIDPDLSFEKHRPQEISTSDTAVISETCENAFNELKKFLSYLEKTEN